jgi:hypothetical protein
MVRRSPSLWLTTPLLRSNLVFVHLLFTVGKVLGSHFQLSFDSFAVHCSATGNIKSLNGNPEPCAQGLVFCKPGIVAISRRFFNGKLAY